MTMPTTTTTIPVSSFDNNEYVMQSQRVRQQGDKKKKLALEECKWNCSNKLVPQKIKANAVENRKWEEGNKKYYSHAEVVIVLSLGLSDLFVYSTPSPCWVYYAPTPRE